MNRAIVTDWDKYAPYFRKSEFDCKHTGKNEMTVEFMDALLALRRDYGKAMIVNSGFRDVTHPVEASKLIKHGEHVQGACADFRVSGSEAYQLLELIFTKHTDFNRIGISLKRGAPAFIHLGIGGKGLPSKTIWSY